MREEYVGIAKRENNKKRNYLVVNKKQGKHVPTSPGEALRLFEMLGRELKEKYKGEKVLVVGFAETATAIGTKIAIGLESYYMQTTREQIEGVSYFYFSETHSHATEQKLVREDLDQIIPKINHVLFIEDEITTGNTVLNIIELLEKSYPKKIKYAVASLINGMNEVAREDYIKRGIAVHYSLKTVHDTFGERAKVYKGDGSYYKGEAVSHRAGVEDTQITITEVIYSNPLNPRRLVEASAYDQGCKGLWEQVEQAISINQKDKILVLGTEELMYPALYVGKQLEEKGLEVKCHATTRSPIEVSMEIDYPLHTRFELKSVYEDKRIVYLYDLAKYDKVIIVTDAPKVLHKGMTSLIKALQTCGNTTIYCVRWV